MLSTTGDATSLKPLEISARQRLVYRWRDLTEPQRRQLEELAYRWGETYDSYLANSRDRSYFFLADGQGALAYRRVGRHVLIVGGLLAPPERCAQLLEEFVEQARKRWWTVNFFNLPRDHVKLYREHGFEITKCGEEPFICLEETDWTGSAYSWLRRQENFCLRQGAHLSELTDMTPEDRQRLDFISREHLKGTLQGREMSFFVGRFDPDDLQRRRIFVARDADNTIIAFVMCNPALDGAMWAVEAYRRAPDSPRGVVPFAILQTLRLLKGEGVRYVSLSLCPCLRSGRHNTGGNFYFRHLCEFWWNCMNWIFDVQGIYHFKSRFRPRYREMFLASYPKTTVGAMWSIPYLWGLFAFNPLRLFRKGMLPRRDRDLAAPPPRPERLIRALKVGKVAKQTPPAEVPPAGRAAANKQRANEHDVDRQRLDEQRLDTQRLDEQGLDKQDDGEQATKGPLEGGDSVGSGSLGGGAERQ